MKLTALRLHNVKRFGGHGVAIEGIGDGVNVLTAANEHGKSTAFEALHALFFQPHTSAGKSVQLLKPYSGGNPLVEADIAAADGQFRLTKQFYTGKRAEVRDLGTGRLIAQADEAEAFIGELTRGGSAGPAGLLWVRQGMTGIEQRSKGDEESDKRVRETLLSSVQGEVEALTGGRRMAEILSACEEELFKLVTATLRPKAGGRYAGAIEERDRLASDEVRLASEVTTLREALDKRRVARMRLTELEQPDEQKGRKDAIAAAEAAFEAAKSHSEALKAAEAEATLARHHAEKAATDLAGFTAALEQAGRLAQQRVETQTRRDQAVSQRAMAAAESDQALAAVTTAETEEREHRALLTRLDAAMQARDAADRLAQLRGQLERAEAARLSVEQAEAALAVLIIAPAAIAQLQTVELDLVRLRAAQEATLPTLRMDYAAGGEGTITAGGVPVDGGADVGFAHSLRLDIAGVGALTLRSNRPAEADRGIEQAIGKRDKLLDALGVESLAAALQRQAEAQQKSAALDLARQRLADLAPQGLAALQAEIARWGDLGAVDLVLKGDPAALRVVHATLAQTIDMARNLARERQPALAQATTAAVAAEARLAVIVAEIATLDSQLGPVAERGARQAALTEARIRLQQAHAAAEAHAAALRPKAHDLVAAEATLRRLRSVAAAADQEAGQLRVTLADLNGNITARADSAVEEVWQETNEALAKASADVARFESEVAVLTRLRAGLIAARSSARDLYLKPVVSELLPLLGLLFDDISIQFDEDTLLLQSVRRNGLDEQVERLSGGMREQLSVLTRLAFASLLARDGRPAPVILDDALVYSDDDRIERMFNALHQQAREQQILVFSCRQRAFAKLGGNVLQMQPWTPTA
ncbi:AAA domain-containing protein [Devosia sp. YR412]|uniref:AAA family ATPase n=1 Tax=Devosia sp. YR412 TaxID=1881030 RepID=UPI0008D61F4F|nr:AAA family ATPase [Devosia sp. YR412]SEQ54413.1 AAA domain-containing protein [Devosia sp. YR412]